MVQKLKLLTLMIILVASFSFPSLAVHAANNNENDNAQTENIDSETENNENTNENNNANNDNNGDAGEEKENNQENSKENEESSNNNEDNEDNEENMGNENNGNNENDNDASNNANDPDSVSAGEKITFGTGSYITMPDDLPEGSTLTVSDASNSPAAQNALQNQGIVPSGDVYAFDLDTNGNNDYSGSFELALSIGANASGGAEMYYYNEGAQEWEKQSGTHKNDTGSERVITANLSHLSMYGVFGIDINAEANSDEECDASDMNIQFDEETEVCADQRVQIDESENYVTMPDDLPAGTTLRVKDINESNIVTEANGLIRCGEAMEFDVNTPEGESFAGHFDLKMSYCNGFSADDIYSYENEDWEAQGGEFDYNDFTLNLQTGTLGSLGVFALDDEYDETAAGKNSDGDSKDSKKAPKEAANNEKDGNNGNNENANNDEDNAADIAVNDNDNDKDDGFLLPSTATNMFTWIVIGSILALGGITLLIIRKIRNRTI